MIKTINCSKCGQGRILGSGYVAQSMTAKTWLATLRKMGWTAAPRVLCRSCSCPMTADELQEFKRLCAVRKQDNNHILHMKVFLDAMRWKYGEARVNLYAQSWDEQEAIKPTSQS